MPSKTVLRFITAGRDFYPEMKIPYVVEMNQKSVPEKLNDRLQIVLIENGTGIINFKKDKTGILAPMLLLLREKEQCLIENPTQLKMHKMYFHPDVVNSDFTFSNIYDPEYPFSRTARQDRFILKPLIGRHAVDRIIPIDHITANNLKNLFTAIHHELDAQKDKFWPCTARGLLIQLLFLICFISENTGNNYPGILLKTSQKNNQDDLQSRNLVEKTILHLYLNYSEKISIEDIARALNTNRTTLASSFKQQMKMTVLGYLTKLRMDIAASLLHNTRLSINEIMAKVGFQDATHFGRIFKKHFETTPADYRKKYVKKNY
ncbi:MAG: helix-turn-helix transcriptional regulator [Spirochaetales bacterium]|nr:helix-turn-helix transcriptional regulator [Spirochaetales bacterium]